MHVDTLVMNSSELITARTHENAPVRAQQVEELDIIRDGAMAIHDGKVVAVGTSQELNERFTAANMVDAQHRLVSPAFADPHTHLVHGGSRHVDWEEHVRETASGGISGGINITLEHTSQESDQSITARAVRTLDLMLAHGTTAIEAKTGYGLSRDSELRLLSLITGLRHTVKISPTFLGAHTVPTAMREKRGEYVHGIVEMLPEVLKYTNVCDIAIDPVSFTREEAEIITDAAVDLGFTLRFHADQTADAGGTLFAVENHALTVDHLDYTNNEGLEALSHSPTIGVIFPAAHHHMLDPTPALHSGAAGRDLVRWAHRLKNSSAALALSTDYNPGTAPCASMQDVMRLATRLYRFSAAAVWNLCTINAAHALGQGTERGSLEEGKVADFLIWNVSDHKEVPYWMSGNLVSEVFVAGKRVTTGCNR